MEAIVAIDSLTGAIGYQDGGLILENKEDKKKFYRITKDKTMIVGRKTYDTLPTSVKERDIWVVHSNNVDFIKQKLEKDSKNKILIGGGLTYKTFEYLVKIWHITWFCEEIDEGRDTVIFEPNLKEFEPVNMEYLDELTLYRKYYKK